MHLNKPILFLKNLTVGGSKLKPYSLMEESLLNNLIPKWIFPVLLLLQPIVDHGRT